MKKQKEKTNNRTEQKGELDEQDEIKLASPRQIMFWKFTKHKVAVASLGIIILMFLIALFAPFFAPYQPNTRHSMHITAPPQGINFFDKDGFNLRPFVYKLNQVEYDVTRGTRIYEEDITEKYPIYFFVRGEEYELFGLIESDIHLFGTEKGEFFVFGTDTMGRDVLSQIIYGARVSISVALLGVTLSVILGIFLGGIAGYYGGIIDNLIQRLSETLISFPSIPLWMGLAAALPADWSPLQVYVGIVVILSIIGWVGLGRQVRSKILSLKEEDFIEAARLNGCSKWRIILGHMIPQFYSHIIATLSLSIPGMIIGETSLSFLGIGLRRPVVSWGVLLQQAQSVRVLTFNPWLLIPSIFVVIIVLAFNFLGDGIRDAADPFSSVS